MLLFTSALLLNLKDQSQGADVIFAIEILGADYVLSRGNAGWTQPFVVSARVAIEQRRGGLLFFLTRYSRGNQTWHGSFTIFTHHANV